MELELATQTYCCPGESHPISRAVHLGRLARFYPACRSCPLADDTGSLSPKHVARLLETRRRAPAINVFDREGLRGIAGTEITAELVRRVAAEFAELSDRSPEREERLAAPIVIAQDGRPLSAEFVEAAAEGLRWAGRNVIDIGAMTEGGFVATLASLTSAGGMLIGNAASCTGAGAGAHDATIRFWSAPSTPLSDESIEILRERVERDPSQAESRDRLRAPVEAPSIPFGTLQRQFVETDYLETLRPYFHALRPLRVQIQCSSPTVWRYLDHLATDVACVFLPRDATATAQSSADFTATIDGDGHAWQIADERGVPVPAHQLFAVLAAFLLRDAAGATIVLEEDTPLEADAWISAGGGRIVRSAPARAAMDRTMRRQAAIAGGGPSGRVWFGGNVSSATAPSVDALRALAILLTRLSESDQPLSTVCAPSILAQ